MTIFWFLFGMSVFIIFFAMIGYPLLLKILDKLIKPPKHSKCFSYIPTVTYMIVAHNEEKVILKKLENAITIDYPKEKLEILVASDNSTDETNDIVKRFIEENLSYNIRLFTSKDHKGKTNVQNEAQKTITSEIIAMTDANTMVKPDAIKELVSCFVSDDIAYVCGKLVYSNPDTNTSDSESTYWNLELSMRDIESRFQTITAGNGAIYACRNSDYIYFDPIYCHDSAMPYAYALMKKRAIFNPNAIAIEKAGENNKDEFNRKVRMNRIILGTLKDSLVTANFFKYRWFSLFYFGHRTCRYSLWIAHIIAFLSSLFCTIFGSTFALYITIFQIIVYLVSFIAIKTNVSNKLFRLIGYYGMTVCAQIVGVWMIITGKVKPVWEKAESTR